MKLLTLINWKIALFTALLLPVLMSLGFWQLRREAEKRDLEAVYEARQTSRPVTLAEVATRSGDELTFQPLVARGHYDNERVFLLDNRSHEGRLGMEVISPFITTDDQILLVNRGWVERGAYRSDLPRIDAVEGSLELRANVYVPQGKPYMLGEEDPFAGWPRVLQVESVPRMYRELDTLPAEQALPFTVRLQAGEPGVFSRYWQAVNMTPEKHRGYAIQWFTMAAALVLLFVYSIVKAVKEDRNVNNE